MTGFSVWIGEVLGRDIPRDKERQDVCKGIYELTLFKRGGWGFTVQLDAEDADGPFVSDEGVK
jgi:hypothetical protein